MERITNISQLIKGDMIVNVKGEVITILEFREVHPYNYNYSIMLTETHDGAPKFYNKRLEEDEWFLLDTSRKQWAEIYQMVIDNLTKKIDYYKEMIKTFNK